MTKPLKFHQTLNQPARNARHGRHRPASAPSHRHPADRAGDGAGGAITWHSGGTPVNYTKFADTSQDTGDGANAVISWMSLNWDLMPMPMTTLPSVVTTGELIGHRGWWLIDGYLYSIAHERRWEPGGAMEGDVDGWVGRNTVEGGVYSYKDADVNVERGARHGDMTDRLSGHWLMTLLSLADRHRFIMNADAFVTGTVKLWGQVVEHETGYRSQFARIKSLDAIHVPRYLDEPAAGWLQRVKERYLP